MFTLVPFFVVAIPAQSNHHYFNYGGGAVVRLPNVSIGDCQNIDMVAGRYFLFWVSPKKWRLGEGLLQC